VEERRTEDRRYQRELDERALQIPQVRL
jgi:hypothetical protein